MASRGVTGAAPSRASKRDGATQRARSLRSALIQILLLALVIGIAEVPPILDNYGAAGWLVASQTACGVAYVMVGAIAWDRRPSNFTGPLLCLAGFVSLGASLANVSGGLLGMIGFLLAEGPIAMLLHLLLAFPAGRLQGRWDRVLVAAGYLITIGLQVPQWLYRRPDGTALWVADRPDIVRLADDGQSILGSVTLVLVAVVLVRRVRHSPAVAGERRSRALVYAYGGLTIVFLPFSAQVLRPLLGLGDISLFVLQVIALGGVPFVFAAGLLLGGFARTGQIEELGVWLGSREDARTTLREALADTLGDDSLQLLFRRADLSGLFDSAGMLVEQPAGDPTRGRVDVEVRGAPSALIVYDTSLVADPALVESAGRVVALALERERLTAELIREREAVRESRTRIVQVGDEERRRFARDLHDLLQSRLVLAAMHAGTLAAGAAGDPRVGESAARLRLELEGAIAELRQLVHGVLPALLLESGLFAAAEDLVDRVRLPADFRTVELDRSIPIAVASHAYFILAESLANAVKHSQASHIDVSIVQTATHLDLTIQDNGVGGAAVFGSGLRGVSDRVEALGGTLEHGSPVGGGTRVRVRLPYDD